MKHSLALVKVSDRFLSLGDSPHLIIPFSLCLPLTGSHTCTHTIHCIQQVSSCKSECLFKIALWQHKQTIPKTKCKWCLFSLVERLLCTTFTLYIKVTVIQKHETSVLGGEKSVTLCHTYVQANALKIDIILWVLHLWLTNGSQQWSIFQVEDILFII